MSKRAVTWASTSVGLICGLAGAFFVIRAVVREWETVASAIEQANAAWFLPASAVALLSMAGIGLAWRRALTLVGNEVALSRALFWYFLGQLGKYVPGGIWPVVGRAEMATRDGISRRDSYSAVLLSLGATYLAAILTAAMLLPFAPGIADRVPATPWVMVLLPVGFAIVHPRVLERALGTARRLSNRPLAIDVPSWPSSISLVLRHVPSWVGIGLATWLVAVAFGATPDPVTIVAITALSWVIGFLVVPVPGGLGVREAIFTAAAAIPLGAGLAATVAIIARVLFMLVDLTGAGISAVARSRSPSSATS